MGTVCSRRQEHIDIDIDVESESSLDDADDADVLESWRRVVRRARRLGYTRRKWAFLGHHLREVKARGRRWQ
jgi:hypothetical protein